MWSIAGAVIVVVLILMSQLPPLHKKKMYKEIAAYVFLTLAALTLFSLQKMPVPIPNPLEWISVVYRSLGLVIRK